MKRGELYKKITEELKSEDLNILQISKKIGVRWETVKNAVESLAQAGFLELKNRKWRLKQEFAYDEDTLLGLPVNEEQKRQAAEIANRVQEFVRYNNTFLQKAVTTVIEREGLDIPYGWYLFGKCCVVSLQERFRKGYKSTKAYDKTIREVVSEFRKYKDTNELMQDCYADNTLYQSRLHIDQIFHDRLTKSSMRHIEMSLKQILFKIKDPAHFFMDSLYSSVAMLKKLDEEELNDLKMELFSAFRVIWEMIATQELKKSLNVEMDDSYFEMRIESLKSIADSYLVRLKDSWPEMRFNESIEKLREKFSKRLRTN